MRYKTMMAILMSSTMIALVACGGSTSAVPTSDQMITVGQRAFESSCMACHGEDATGLPSLGKDLVASNFVQGLGDDELVTFIKTGRSSGDALNTTGISMPAKGGNPMLSEADMRAIVAWLRSIQK